MIKTEFNQFLLYYQNKSHFFMTFYNNQNTIGIFEYTRNEIVFYFYNPKFKNMALEIFGEKAIF